jgi:predicted ArsR family transcriptional regulator
MASAGEAILFQLKTLGSARAEMLATRLGVSAQAARQALGRLLRDGLVQFADEIVGRGRPRRVWRLTAAAARHFPDTHGQLTIELLCDVRAAFGSLGVERLLAARAQSLTDAYRVRLARIARPRHRLRRLAEIRSEEGYMARVSAAPDGSFLFVEDHCPICAAATACQGLCAVELAVFREVLGPGWTIERIDHVLAGARRCAYRACPPSPASLPRHA